MKNFIFTFTAQEKDYLSMLVTASKVSLDEICESQNSFPEILTISPEEKEAEYQIIDSLLEKLNYDH